MIMTYFGELFEIIFRRDDIAARSLDRLDKKSAELRALCFGVPGSRVFMFEFALKFMDKMIFGGFGIARKGERNTYGKGTNSARSPNSP